MTRPMPHPPAIDSLGRHDIADLLQRSERGRLLAPDLDDRQWQDLVDEASTLIDRYAPQWTDRNPSDIGMTLLELFAWLVESLIYRLNRVPEKSYLAFLNLMGVSRAPRLPARTLLTFTAQGDVLELAEGSAAQTQGTESNAPIVFETDTSLTVLPAGVAGIFRIDSADGPEEQRTDGGPAGSIPLRLAGGRGGQICVAVDTEMLPMPGLDLYVEPFRPPVDRHTVERIEWVCSVATAADPDVLDHAPWSGLHWGPWHPLDVRQDGTAGLLRPGVVRLRVPEGVEWTAQDPHDPNPAKTWSVPGSAELPAGAHRWLGLRISNDSPPAVGDAPPGAEPVVVLRVDRMLPNTTTASCVATVTGESLGEGTGKPGQLVRLAHWPLYAQPSTDTPYDHLRITVAGAEWHAVDQLPEGPGQCYLLDPVSGEITFGDADQTSGHGTPPGLGQPIVAERYRYVSAGAAGNVPANVVAVPSNSAVAQPDKGTPKGVTNPVPAVGGADEEPIEETKRRAPQLLRHRDRAVTSDDYELLARTAAPGIALVRCLAPRLYVNEPGGRTGDPWTYANLQRAPGVVNVLVVPDLGPQVPEPTPSLALVHEVIRVLDQRRPIATCLHVDGPRYVRIAVHAAVTVFPEALDQGLVPSKEAEFAKVEADIRAFLHPVHGREGQGWQIGQSVYISDLYQAVRPEENVGFITSLTLAPESLGYFDGDDPENQRPFLDTIGEPSNYVRIADYELVCPGTVHADDGEGDRP